MTQQAGIFGYPLAHSLSPAFQQAAFDFYSLPARYHAWSTSPKSLGDEVSKLRGAGYLGANVTVPHKEAVVPHLDDVDSLARLIGAVNTIVKRDGRLIGHNTDAHGFIKSCERSAASSRVASGRCFSEREARRERRRSGWSRRASRRW